MIFVDKYVRYAELNSIEDEFYNVSDFIVLSGKMPSWYATALVAYFVKKGAKIIAVFRPPAEKIIVVYSEDDDIPIGTWIELTKKQLEFCRGGQIYV